LDENKKCLVTPLCIGGHVSTWKAPAGSEMKRKSLPTRQCVRGAGRHCASSVPVVTATTSKPERVDRPAEQPAQSRRNTRNLHLSRRGRMEFANSATSRRKRATTGSAAPTVSKIRLPGQRLRLIRIQCLSILIIGYYRVWMSFLQIEFRPIKIVSY
jgi:hypothetical protein